MLQEERFDIILREVSAKGAVKVSQLAEMMNISESTIRRDINELDAAGKLRKVFGGAVSAARPIITVDADMDFRNAQNLKQKIDIARYSASLIKDHDVVFLDAGTTTEKMIDYLDNRTVVYVTNSLTNIQKLAEKGLTAYLTGGNLKVSTQALVGSPAIDLIKSFNFTKSFLGANGIDIKKGLTTPGMDEAAVKKAIIENSHKVYVVADSSKFGMVSAVTFSSLERAEIITEKLNDREFLKHTQVTEVYRK